MQAIAQGAEKLEIEHKDGCEEVYACAGDFGTSIGVALDSSSEEAKSLRSELYAMHKRPRRIEVGGHTYELRCRIHESFGEDAFEVTFRRLGGKPPISIPPSKRPTRRSR